MTTWLRMLAAELPLLRDLPDLADRPLPRVGVVLGPSLRGWMLRLAAAVGVGVLLVVATQRAAVAAGFGWTVVVAAVVVMAVRPSAMMAQVAVVVAGLLIGLDAYGPFDPVVFVLIPLAYTAVRLAWWAERVTLMARIELAALATGVPSGPVVLGGTLGLGAGVFLIAGRPFAPAVVVGGAALVVLSWAIFAQRDERTDTPPASQR